MAVDERTVLPVLPTPDGVVFPGVVVTLMLDSDEAIVAASAERFVVLVTQRDAGYASVGTVASVEQVGELPNGQRAAIVRGLHRARLGAAVPTERAGLWLSAEAVVDPEPNAEQREQAERLRSIMATIADRRRSRRLPEILRTVDEPGALADAVTGWSDADLDHKQSVLEAIDVTDRLELVLAWARSLEVAEQIRGDVVDSVEKSQREFLLRQQLAAIRKELGEDGDDPTDDYRAKLAERVLPDSVRNAVEREIARLERTSAQSPDQSWIRTWLDRILEVPWGTTTQDSFDLGDARRVLDTDHAGLDDVKQRIIEYLAVRKLRHERDLDEADARGGGVIVALVGPPGVGKTSLGESVARALGRRFVRVALGGIRDEAEIRGHRRTYVGSQPGRIARAITEAGVMNPVLLLDEVDKLHAGGWSGDPAAALLEVLDPAQNHTFRDHYLEVDLDLSDVVFLATANAVEAIPEPLLDRMEIVRLDGYTEDEKLLIARQHLLERQLDRNGLRAGEVTIDDAALSRIVSDYTREAGVRGLEREIGKLLRKVAAKVATDPFAVPVHVDADAIGPYLGRARFFAEVGERTAIPGVATGLAVTGSGGDVLFIEATASPGEQGLMLTGQLGDVMKESAQIALSYVRSHASALNIEPAALERRFHVHVPAGAVPKDGPSAGVTMTTALVSLLTGRTVRPAVGMTGEMTLQGLVLPIGGVKQKVLAAHRAGLTEVVLPRRNAPDLDDVPERVRESMTFHIADRIDDVLQVALEPAG